MRVPSQPVPHLPSLASTIYLEELQSFATFSFGTYRPRRCRNKRRRGTHASENWIVCCSTVDDPSAARPISGCAESSAQEQRHRAHHGSAPSKHLLQINKVQIGQPFVQPSLNDWSKHKKTLHARVRNIHHGHLSFRCAINAQCRSWKLVDLAMMSDT